MIQNLETIQEEMDQEEEEEMAEVSIGESENANGLGTETMIVHANPSSLIERRVVYSVHTGSFAYFHLAFASLNSKLGPLNKNLDICTLYIIQYSRVSHPTRIFFKSISTPIYN